MSDGGSNPHLAVLFKPLSLRTAGAEVADRVVTALALGVFVPGQRLPAERDLAASLRVSRATVREAISRLIALGYVEVRRGRSGGAFVLSGAGPEATEMISRTLVSGWDTFERLFDFRGLVEPLIARTAAQRRNPDDVARLRAAVVRYTNASESREASRAADEALHVTIAGATHNPYLVDLSRQIRLDISLGFGAEPYSTLIRTRAIHEHGDLAEAVIAGDGAHAAALASEHFAITESVLRELHDRTVVDRPAPDADADNGHVRG